MKKVKDLVPGDKTGYGIVVEHLGKGREPGTIMVHFRFVSGFHQNLSMPPELEVRTGVKYYDE